MDQKVIEAGMFNSSASAGDRNRYLTELLAAVRADCSYFLSNLFTRQDEDNGQQDHSVQSDAVLNHILSRSETELSLFSVMDVGAFTFRALGA